MPIAISPASEAKAIVMKTSGSTAPCQIESPGRVASTAPARRLARKQAPLRGPPEDAP
jgi:hypothetical protein